jgi:hypothetical protein
VALHSVIPMTAGRPAAARPRGTSSTRSIPGEPARHPRRCAVRSARGTGSPRTRTRPRDPRVVSSRASSPAPETIRVPSCRSLRALTLVAKSPSSSWALEQSGVLTTFTIRSLILGGPIDTGQRGSSLAPPAQVEGRDRSAAGFVMAAACPSPGPYPCRAGSRAAPRGTGLAGRS